jgi:hypothetical protein
VGEGLFYFRSRGHVVEAAGRYKHNERRSPQHICSFKLSDCRSPELNYFGKPLLLYTAINDTHLLGLFRKQATDRPLLRFSSVTGITADVPEPEHRSYTYLYHLILNEVGPDSFSAAS